VSQSIEFLEAFQGLEEPRQLWKVVHPLKEILFLVLCGVISGFTEFSDIEVYGKERIGYLRKFLSFAAGIPSHDTLDRVFQRINPASFQSCFINWVAGLQKEIREIIAVDGKTLRGSFDEGQSAIHMVSAWASKQRLILGQEKTEEKSNEIKAIPKLLELLSIKGAIVTIDAMGCQKDIARQIVEQGGDYMLALKGNHAELYRDVSEFFEAQEKEQFRHSHADTHQTLEKGHGRVEKRRYVSTNDIEWLKNVILNGRGYSLLSGPFPPETRLGNKAHRKLVTTCHPCHKMQNRQERLFENIGVLKTKCIGFSMLISEMTPRAFERTMHLKTCMSLSRLL